MINTFRNIDKLIFLYIRKSSGLLLACIVLSQICVAQDNKYCIESPVHFEHISEADGLLSNNVNCILQDRWGFMWFGTEKGLNRYDGNSFVSFVYKEGDTNCISGNHITCIIEDSKGQIWIGTFENGVSIYNPVTGKFIRYQHDTRNPNSINKGYVAQIYEDSDSRIWICLYGGGLELWNEKDKNFIHHTWDPANDFSIAGNKVKSILEIAKDKFLVGTFEAGDGITDIPEKGHINVFDFNTKRFEPLNTRNQKKPKPHYRQSVKTMSRLVHTIIRDERDNIWFGTYCGVIKYKPSSDEFSYYQNDEISATKLSCNIVRSVCFVQGKVFFGTEGGGLSVLDTATETFVNYKNDINDPNSISDDLVRMVYKDKDQRIWIATNGGGVNIIEPENKHFTLYPNKLLRIDEDARFENTTIRALAAENGEVIIGSYSGMTHLNTKTKSINYIGRNAKIQDVDLRRMVYAVEKAGNNKYWMSFNNMLMKYTTGDGSLSYYYRPGDLLRFETSIKKNIPIINIIERTDGSLWIAYFGSPSLGFNPVQKRIIDHAPSIRTKYDIIDKEGVIWAAKLKADMPEGLVSIDTDWSVKRYTNNISDTNSISSDDILYIYCDRKNNIWIKTAAGLDVLDPKTGNFRHLKGIKYFPDSLVNSICEDGSGNMWFGTDFSLLRMDSLMNVIVYSVNKDLPVHKLESKLVYDKIDDAIYFTSNEGVVKFYPEQLELQQDVKPVYISGMYLFNQPYLSDTSSIIKKHYTFKWHENFLTINFTSLIYSGKTPQNFAYKLEGLNEDWVYIGNSHQANFTNLDPGTYTFKVKGSTYEGLWDMASEPIIITITTPWWNTGSFYLLCIALLILSIWLYNRYRTRLFFVRTQQLEAEVDKRTRQYKEQKEKAEKSEQLRQDFIAKISHEIRTPINAVSGMADLLLTKDPNKEQVEYLEAISNSSDVLLHILNDVLDLSKIEAGKLQIESIVFSIKETIHKVHRTLKFIAEEKGISFDVMVDSRIPEKVIGDPYRLSQIILNLCSNAIKFTNLGHVSIDVERADNKGDIAIVRFAVIDTGIGIPAVRLEELFEDFVQAHNSNDGQYGGTGLGLSISKNLASLMGGKITAESKVGVGSKFVLELPFDTNLAGKISTKPSAHADTKVLNGLRILLADDNEYNRIVAVDTLEQNANIIVDTAENGAVAIGLLQENDYDIVLMDIQMPVLDGIEATKQIRELLPYPKCNTPIIALTATVKKSEQDKCRLAGVDDFLIKPVKPRNLVNAIINLASKNKNTFERHYNSDKTENTVSLHDEEKIIDLAYLIDFCEGDADRINKYIQLYLESAGALLQALNDNALHLHKDSLGTMMHNFRPKAKMMGIQSVVELTMNIENISPTADLPSLINTLKYKVMLSIDQLKKV